MITTGNKKKIQSSVGGKLAVLLLWREIFITTGKKRYITTGKKKDTVVCLMGARFWRLRPEKKKIQLSLEIFITTEKKDTLRQEKKKDTVISGGKLAFFCSSGKF